MSDSGANRRRVGAGRRLARLKSMTDTRYSSALTVRLRLAAVESRDQALSDKLSASPARSPIRGCSRKPGAAASLGCFAS